MEDEDDFIPVKPKKTKKISAKENSIKDRKEIVSKNRDRSVLTSQKEGNQSTRNVPGKSQSFIGTKSSSRLPVDEAVPKRNVELDQSLSSSISKFSWSSFRHSLAFETRPISSQSLAFNPPVVGHIKTEPTLLPIVALSNQAIQKYVDFLDVIVFPSFCKTPKFVTCLILHSSSSFYFYYLHDIEQWKIPARLASSSLFCKCCSPIINSRGEFHLLAVLLLLLL